MRRAFVISVTCFAAGCSLFGLGDFSGGEDPAPGGDAAASDAGTTSDGPYVAPPVVDGGGDAPSGPFCEVFGQDAAVCDDFETPGTFTGRWPENDKYLGTLEVMDGIGIDGTRGLRFSATPRADGQIGQDARVMLGYTTPSAASELDCEVAVRLSSIPPTTYSAAPLHVQLEGVPSGRQAIGFYLDGARTLSVNPIVFDENGAVVSGGASKPVATVPLGAWTRVRLVAELAKSPPSLYVYVDGTLRHAQAMTGFQPAVASIRIGANYAGTTDGGTIDFDLDDARLSWK